MRTCLRRPDDKSGEYRLIASRVIGFVTRKVIKMAARATIARQRPG